MKVSKRGLVNGMDTYLLDDIINIIKNDKYKYDKMEIMKIQVFVTIVYMKYIRNKESFLLSYISVIGFVFLSFVIVLDAKM